MILNVNDSLQGFRILAKRELHDISAILYEMKHEKSGAELIYIDRDDINKTFAIAFTTIPEDDTGVFHILEHSVLCGSEKYPVKEPFVELLKSSLNTFLNAMTYNDKTVYPVCSKNDADFLNLISVYMDAVLHPSMLTEERIFRQEGWHYELDGGELCYNGVVYNEMKGAYSQVDNLSAEKLMSMLYPGTCYAKDSGGSPDFIPSLTYEQFVNAHKRYYHPSNSKIVLDGAMDLDAVLSLIDSYLAEYDAEDTGIAIEMPKQISRTESRAEFEISEGEDPECASRVIIGYHSTECDEMEKGLALSLIKDYLAGSNEAPLKKALLDSGLCQDVIVYDLNGIMKNSLVIEVRNTRECDTEKITKLIDDTVKREIATGLSRDMLAASLNLSEFRLREADTGSLPKGLTYALSTLETWLYGRDPALNLCFSDILASLRAKLDTDYYEKLAEEILVNNESRATLVMVPSKTLAEEKSRRLKEHLARVKAAMSEDELAKISRECEDFKAWQAREDTAEQLDTLPTLALSDISSKVEKIPTEVRKIDGAELLYHPIETGGIVYSSLVFDASDLTGDELCILSFMSNAMLNLRTEKSDALTLQQRTKASFGVFVPVCTCYADKEHNAKPAFVLKAHTLERNKEKISELAKEVLYTTDYTDKQTLKKIFSQMRICAEEAFIADGHTTAMNRAGAHESSVCAVNEYLEGYDNYIFLKKYEADFDALADGLIEKMKELTDKLFVKERLTVNLSCEKDDKLFADLVGAVRSGKAAGKAAVAPLPKANEGLIIPSPVAYASIANHLYKVADEYSGAAQVARSILNFVHLWSCVRVQGGAYGAGLLYRYSGKCAFYSYRDPNPKRTLECFRASGDFLRNYLKDSPDLTKLIIGAVGNATPILTPRTATEAALINYIAGVSYEDECRIIEQILNASPSDLLLIADTVDRIASEGSICIVGGKELIESCKVEIDTVLEL